MGIIPGEGSWTCGEGEEKVPATDLRRILGGDIQPQAPPRVRGSCVLARRPCPSSLPAALYFLGPEMPCLRTVALELKFVLWAAHARKSFGYERDAGPGAERSAKCAGGQVVGAHGRERSWAPGFSGP